MTLLSKVVPDLYEIDPWIVSKTRSAKYSSLYDKKTSHLIKNPTIVNYITVIYDSPTDHVNFIVLFFSILFSCYLSCCWLPFMHVIVLARGYI